MAINNHQWPSERPIVTKVASKYEVDHIFALTAQMSSLTTHLVALTNQQSQPSIEVAYANRMLLSDEGYEQV